MKRELRSETLEIKEFENKKKMTSIDYNKSEMQDKLSHKIDNSFESHLNGSSNMHDKEEMRVRASSKVNFSKLSEEEQLCRYKNQVIKVQTLKAQIKKIIKTKGGKISRSLKVAQEKLYSAKHELPDRKHLLENLLEAITTGKLKPNSLAYCQICAILRSALGTSYTNSKYLIQLPEEYIAITSHEYKAYTGIALGADYLRSIVGLEQPLKVIEKKNLEQQLHYLNIQMLNEVLKD